MREGHLRAVRVVGELHGHEHLAPGFHHGIAPPRPGVTNALVLDDLLIRADELSLAEVSRVHGEAIRAADTEIHLAVDDVAFAGAQPLLEFFD